ncbi:MAG: hypothetical protein GYB67_05600, partial [Chloroflexi bacterium]|nr:hypothetical protein [Chloroflexota bacterium]
MITRNANRWALITVTGLTLIGWALRLSNLNAASLRGDEAFTVIHWMREPLADTLANIATVDPHPPLAYALYRGWALLLGGGELTVRLLPALFNVLGIPVIYALGRRINGQTLGILAALLWAINPYQIWHAQDARNYAIWAVLSPLAVWLALRALEKDGWRNWLLYIVAAALAAYVYYLELFAVAAVNIYVLLIYHRSVRTLLRWIAAQAVIALLLAPWYLQERLLVSSGYGGTTGGFDP